MNTVQKTIKHWDYLFPYAHVPKNEHEYETMVGFIGNLMQLSRQQKDERITTLLKLVATNIEIYEQQRYLTKTSSPIEALKFLMEVHGIEQGDLPEIGSQPLVSKILSGERQLTVEHIKALSKRFNVSPTLFIK